jgi:hypothetical protein
MRAGWRSEINQLPIGEALPYDFDGEVLNLNGVEIDIPFGLFKRFRKLQYKERYTKT